MVFDKPPAMLQITPNLGRRGQTGIAVTAKLAASHPETRVLVLSMYDQPEYVLESAKAGAHGYLRKDTLPEDLRAAIRLIHSGETCFGKTLEAGAPAPPTSPESWAWARRPARARRSRRTRPRAPASTRAGCRWACS